MHIIGIDCATDPRKVGLAFADVDGGRARITDVALGGTAVRIDESIVRHIAASPAPTLIAIDAPLGWPSPLGSQLVAHSAGQALGATANQLFRRETDDVVHKHLHKRPLDVGADRIARCAHAALALLARLRAETGRPIPLAWSPGHVEQCSAIEVYPAATLAGRSYRSAGYKGTDAESFDARQEIAAALAGELDIAAPLGARIAEVDHLLDAVVCVLAAHDFLRRDVIHPVDAARAEREGWIWVRAPLS